MATPISENQYNYLKNMASGKNSTGGAANGGQQAWAKAQLNSSSYAPAVNAVKNSVTQQQPTQAQPTIQPTSRANQTIDTVGGLVNQSPFQYKAPDAFKYDMHTDPAYQAALASAQQNITQQQADTNARLRAGGQGKSSYSESVANQIGVKEMGRVSTEVLPQLISQAYQRYADNANRDLQIQNANYGAQQDQISNLARVYALQDQQDFQNPMAEAQLTGQYLPGEARGYINAINALKGQAEASGTSREQMLDYRNQADAYRAALQGLGVDPSLFGANVNQSTSMQNMNRAGTQTLAAQNQNFNQGMANKQFDRGVVESDRAFNEDTRRYDQQFEYTQGRDKVKDNQWREEFDRILKQDGVQNALAWASHSVSQQNANTSSGNLALSREEFNYRKDKDALSNKAQTDAKISAKESADNFVSFKTNVQNMDFLDGMNYLQHPQVSSQLSDSDYKAAIKYLESLRDQG